MYRADSRALRENRASLWARASELLARAEGENRAFTTEEDNEFNTLHAEMTALAGRIDTIERLELARADDVMPTIVGDKAVPTAPERSAEDEAAHSRAVMNYLRYGENRMSLEDRQVLSTYRSALQTTSGAGGGFLVPPAFRAGVTEAMKTFGGMRVSGATIITTSEGQDLPFATNDDTGNEGEILSEGSIATELSPTFGQRVLKAYVYSTKYVRVSNTLLNDSAFDLAGFLTNIFARRIGRVTNRNFTTGAGANEPSGIIGDATLGKTAAGATSVVWDEIIDLIHSVDPAYRAMPAFGLMFHDTTLRDLKKLKDGDGQLIWSLGMQFAEPDRINSYRYTINQDMPTIATGNKAILAGDFSNYVIRDVDDLAVRRLEELYALYNQTVFIGFSRHDGALIDAGQAPVKYLQLA